MKRMIRCRAALALLPACVALSPVFAAQVSAPEKGLVIRTQKATLEGFKDWSLPEPEVIPFKGELPIKGAGGSTIKARVGDGVIYVVSMYAGQQALKVGEKWSVDTRYPDNVTGSYTFLIEKAGEGVGLRSYQAQQGRFQDKPFVLLDLNSNGRFDDAGKDGLVFEKKMLVKVGEQAVFGADKFDVQVVASGTTVTFGKAIAFAAAFGADGGEGDEDAALEAWNQVRAALGLLPVRRNKEIEGWGYKHIEYMKAVGSLVHPEDKAHPKYSPEGHKAGMQSDLSAGQSSAKGSVLSLLDTFFHRIVLIQPERDEVGISYDAGSRYAVVNYGSGARRKDGKWQGPIAYPPDGATGVRPGWSGHEGPTPLPVAPPQGGVGQTVTLTFPPGQRPKDAKLTLSDAGGAAVEGWTSTPEKPAASMFGDNMNTVCFIASAPLQNNTRYKAKVEATLGGQPFVKEWSFTTGEGRRFGGGGGRGRR